MSTYREASVLAADLLASGEVDDPTNARNEATRKVFPSSVSLQGKGCPKGAFLGLCNAGLIQGVSAGNYARASKNGQYAVRAVEILNGNRFLASQPELLWKKVAGNTKTPNHQIDVVIGLWEAKRII